MCTHTKHKSIYDQLFVKCYLIELHGKMHVYETTTHQAYMYVAIGSSFSVNNKFSVFLYRLHLCNFTCLDVKQYQSDY